MTLTHGIHSCPPCSELAHTHGLHSCSELAHTHTSLMLQARPYARTSLMLRACPYPSCLITPHAPHTPSSPMPLMFAMPCPSPLPYLAPPSGLHSAAAGTGALGLGPARHRTAYRPGDARVLSRTVARPGGTVAPVPRTGHQRTAQQVRPARARAH